MQRYQWLVGLAAGGFATASVCATDVGGLICADTTWDVPGSPYVVTADAGGTILVACDATLTIEPGVEVRFEADMGINVGYPGFGPGCLVARGTEALPILFTSNQPYEDPPFDAAPGDWGRIVFSDDSCDAEFDTDNGAYLSGGILEWVIVEYGGHGGPAITAESSSPYILHTRVRKIAHTGIHADLTDAPRIRIEHCDVSECFADAHGAGIHLTGGLDHLIENNVIHDNVAGRTDQVVRGGGLYINAPTTLEDNTIRDNTAHVDGYYDNSVGGGIYFDAGSDGSILRGNTFTDNATTTTGGGCQGWGGTLAFHQSGGFTLDGNTITGSSASYGAGAIYISESDGFAMMNNTITGSEAASEGGAIYVYYSSNGQFTNNTITGSTATVHRGGAMYLNRGGGAVFTDNTITGNTAGEGAGAFYFDRSADVKFEDNTISDNTAATESGGTIWFFSSARWYLLNNTIENNIAGNWGGAVYVRNSADGTLAYNTITGNTASGHGGGVAFNNSPGGGTEGWMAIDGNTIMDNRIIGEGGDGGGLYLLDSGNKVIRSNVINGNQALGVDSDGGAMRLSNSPGCELQFNEIIGNTCTEIGGAIFLWTSGNFTMTETVVRGNRTVADPSTGGIWVGGPSPHVSLAGNPDLDTYNSLAGNDGYQIWNDNLYDDSGDNDIDASYMNWCTTETQQIAAGCWDHFDDSALAFVLFFPPVEDGENCCPNDLDGSGAIDFGDIIMLLTAWGECAGCPEDLDGSGVVDFADILVILTEWGPC